MAWTDRTEMMVGAEGLARLRAASVMVVGVGGVGGAAAEMLARAGVGRIVAVDNDEVSETNLNRQVLALRSTVGMPKCDVLKPRLMDINPDLDLLLIEDYLSELNISEIFERAGRVDYVVDAIDTLSPKIALIQHCLSSGIPLVSSMGAGAKLDATAVRIADMSGTYECPLAHMLRKRLHRLGISGGFQAVFSVERPREGATVMEESRNKKSQVGTISYLPAVFGCVCAQAAVTHILG